MLQLPLLNLNNGKRELRNRATPAFAWENFKKRELHRFATPAFDF